MPITRTYIQAHAQWCSHLQTPTDIDEENQVITEKTKENTCVMVSQEMFQLHNSFVCCAKRIKKQDKSDFIGISILAHGRSLYTYIITRDMLSSVSCMIYHSTQIQYA